MPTPEENTPTPILDGLLAHQKFQPRYEVTYQFPHIEQLKAGLIDMAKERTLTKAAIETALRDVEIPSGVSREGQLESILAYLRFNLGKQLFTDITGYNPS